MLCVRVLYMCAVDPLGLAEKKFTPPLDATPPAFGRPPATLRHRQGAMCRPAKVDRLRLALEESGQLPL